MVTARPLHTVDSQPTAVYFGLPYALHTDMKKADDITISTAVGGLVVLGTADWLAGTLFSFSTALSAVPCSGQTDTRFALLCCSAALPRLPLYII